MRTVDLVLMGTSESVSRHSSILYVVERDCDALVDSNSSFSRTFDALLENISPQNIGGWTSPGFPIEIGKKVTQRAGLPKLYSASSVVTLDEKDTYLERFIHQRTLFRIPNASAPRQHHISTIPMIRGSRIPYHLADTLHPKRLSDHNPYLTLFQLLHQTNESMPTSWSAEVCGFSNRHMVTFSG